MEVKKSQKASLQKSSMLYFLIGLNIVLLSVLLMFNYRYYDEVPEMKEEIVEAEPLTEAVLIEIPQPELPPPPPPPTDAPPPPPPPVVIDKIEMSPEPVETPPIINQDEKTPPKIEFKPTTGTKVTQVDLTKIAAKAKGSTEERELPPVTVNRVAEMAVYPGCEKYRGKKRELIKCFGEELGNDILKYLDTEFPDVNKETVGVRLEFHVDKKGYITNINPKFGDDIFKPEAKRALEKTAEYLRRKGQTIEPAKMDDGSSATLIFTQDVKLRNPNY